MSSKENPTSDKRDSLGRFIGSGNPAGRPQGALGKKKAPTQEEWVRMIGEDALEGRRHLINIIKNGSDVQKLKGIQLLVTEYGNLVKGGFVRELSSGKVPKKKKGEKAPTQEEWVKMIGEDVHICRHQLNNIIKNGTDAHKVKGLQLLYNEYSNLIKNKLVSVTLDKIEQSPEEPEEINGYDSPKVVGIDTSFRE